MYVQVVSGSSGKAC